MKLLHCLVFLMVATFTCPGGEAFVDQKLGIAFPEILASLTFEAKKVFSEPELGYSLRYRDDAFLKMDVYVYDKGFTNLEAGVLSKTVRGEFIETLQVIQALEAMGKYSGVKELARQTKTFGPQKIPFLWARHQYHQTAGEGVLSAGKRVSGTYVTGARGKFIKVRLTVADDGITNWANIPDRYIEAVAGLLETKAKPPELRSVK